MAGEGQLVDDFLTEEEIALLPTDAQEKIYKLRTDLEMVRNKCADLEKEGPADAVPNPPEEGQGTEGDGVETVVPPPIATTTPPTGAENNEMMKLMMAMRGEMQEMQRKMTEGVGGPSSFTTTESRFVDEIANAPIPRYEKRELKSYNGLTDPDEFMKYLEDSRITMGATKTRMCQIFPSLLEGDAQTWFHNLPPRSLTGYDDLARKFIVAFSQSRKYKKTQYALFQCKQGPNERLSNYLQRFSKEVMAVERTNDDGPLMALYAGLTHAEFWNTFGSNPPTTFAEACDRARPYINSSDIPGTASLPPAVQAAQSRQTGDKKHEPNGGQEGHNPKRSRTEDRESGSGSKPSFTRYDAFTPLNASRAVIFDKIKNRLQLRPANKMSANGRKDTTKFCKYHNDTGHTTEDCRHLQTELEYWVRRGMLKEFVGQPNTQDNNQRRDKPNGGGGMPPAAGTIYTIHGDIEPSASAAAKRKRYAEECLTLDTRLGKKDFQEPEWAKQPISFSHDDMTAVKGPHQDPIVITARIGSYDVTRVLIDTGSSVDVMFWKAFQKLHIHPQKVEPYKGTGIFGFNNATIYPKGIVNLPVTLGTERASASTSIDFLLVDLDSEYNVILGRPALKDFRAVVSQPHFCVKFPTPEGVGVVRGQQKVARRCYEKNFKHMVKGQDRGLPQQEPGFDKRDQTMVLHTSLLPTPPGLLVDDGRDEAVQPSTGSNEAIEEVWAVEGVPERTFRIGTQLPDEEKNKLVSFLRSNIDVFAWEAGEMPGLDPLFAQHRIPTNSLVRPIHQKLRQLGGEKLAAVVDEVEKLFKAGFIAEVYHPRWISNPVVVPKPGGKWRMCIDFRQLNNASPKDCYPLPNIHRLIEHAAGNERMSFLDAYAGYHQIPLAPEDQDKTAFYANGRTWCYVRMPFGLKNAGATYQRTVNKMFQHLIGKSMEVYIDDMLVRSKRAVDHVTHLAEVFEVLRTYRMKLNPSKCTFGVQSGKFLGYLVSQRGIEANPEKIKAILEMQSPKSIKEVQRLTGRLAALIRFIARYADKCAPFFKTLRTMKNFQWTDDCEVAFQGIKEYLNKLPVLVAPKVGEPLYLYLGISAFALSAVLVHEEERTQRPVYYVSHALLDAETRYSIAEKTALAVVIAARKLRHYFQSGPIIVLTDQPLRQILQRPETSGRLLKWTIELGEFDITYLPRTAIKAQALADFIVEMADSQEDDSQPEHTWVMKVDGSSCAKGSGAGVVLFGPDGYTCEYALRFGFQTTNNGAEYEALILGMKLASKLAAKRLLVYSDSQLVVGQVQSGMDINEEHLKRYHALVERLRGQFETFRIEKIPREENGQADALSKLASAAQGESKSIFVDVLDAPSYDKDETMIMTDGSPTWMTPIIDFLEGRSIPGDRHEAARLRRKAARYTILDGKLYKRSFSLPLLRCLDGAEAREMLQSIHEGDGGSHWGGRTMALQLLRQGFYWPTMREDSIEYSKKCKKCQEHGMDILQPGGQLKSVITPWPFAQWGLDIVGPLPRATGQRQYLLVAIDYFTKWVEAEALATIKTDNVIQFIWKNIICRYGVPESIITDNGTQFASMDFADYCAEQGIKLKFAPVDHPQCNGQVEATNKTLVSGLKKRLGDAKGAWVDELSHVLWAHRTMYKTATGESPYALAFGTEAVIPAEMAMGSHRTQYLQHEENEQLLQLNLDLVEEAREKAYMRNLELKRRSANFYNKRVNTRKFQVGDKVWRKTKEGKKLDANWEGPFVIKAVVGEGTYALEYPSGENILRTWSVQSLKKYHD